jgi:hypothetical protein
MKLKNKMETYSKVANEYGVCVRTIIRWKDSGCRIEDPNSVAEFATKTPTTALVSIFEKVNRGQSLFPLDQMVDVESMNRGKKIASVLDRLAAKIEASKLRDRASELEYFAKTGKKKAKKAKSNALYLIKNKRNGLYKIGISVNPTIREKTLQSQEPELEAVKVWHGQALMEKWWHNHFKQYRVRGEWFSLTSHQIRFMIHKMNDT